MTLKLRYFHLREFDSPDEPGSGEKMHPGTLYKLDAARGKAGLPFHINSGYRTESHNEKVGGVPGSSHTVGRAADIRLKGYTPAQQLRIISELAKAGFCRMGIMWGAFIHVDDDPDKPSAYWDY